MKINIITEEDLQQFKRELLEELRELIKYSGRDVREKWLRTSDVRKILGLSSSSIQNLRTSGKLPYSKVNGTLYYRREDIDSLLSNNLTKKEDEFSTR